MQGSNPYLMQLKKMSSNGAVLHSDGQLTGDGEGTHGDIPVYIGLHPSQLPSHVIRRDETVHEGVLLLALSPPDPSELRSSPGSPPSSPAATTGWR
jgi:hypothetical protein